MKAITAIGWVTLAATAVGCADQSSSTTDTSRSLLAQPRAEDISTTIDTMMLLAAGDPELTIDLLGINVGSVEAPVKVIEFADFGCGFCRRFQLETFPTLRVEFIETEMVEWKFMPFVSGMFANSQAVTEAAECALGMDPRLFALFADRLWVQQSEWKGSDDPAALARQWIGELGGDVSAYDGCMADGTRFQRVRSATALAGQLGIRSTPTFWIVGGGPVQGALPLEAFRQLFTTVHEQLTEDAS